LSVGSMLALAGMLGAWTMQKIASDTMTVSAMIWGTLVGIVAGTLCGFFNGLLITRLKLPPFIVTLGTMSAFRGIAYVMNDGQPYNVVDYTYLGNGDVAGLSISVIIVGAIMVLASLTLRYTTLGRYTYAIGS